LKKIELFRDQWNQKRDLLYKSISLKEQLSQFQERTIKITRKDPTTGVTLSSSRLPTVKQSIQQKYTAVQEEFGIFTPQMPSMQIMDLMEQIHSSLLSLLQVRKQQEKLIQDIKTASQQKQQAENDIISGRPISISLVLF
jgi:hypothetical protein